VYVDVAETDSRIEERKNKSRPGRKESTRVVETLPEAGEESEILNSIEVLMYEQ
jgi:hypothetical protein